jgi:SnoaL-like protein
MTAAFEQLKAEVRELRDKQEIIELYDRFAATMDAGDYDGLAGLFTEGAVFEGMSGGPWTGSA